jgi:hypothetical protein
MEWIPSVKGWNEHELYGWGEKVGGSFNPQLFVFIFSLTKMQTSPSTFHSYIASSDYRSLNPVPKFHVALMQPSQW